MQGAMRGRSIRTFQAALGGSGISKLFLISIGPSPLVDGNACQARSVSGAELAALAALRHRQEQLIERDAAADQALIVRIAHQRLEVPAVRLGQAVFPRVAAEQLLLLVPRFLIPGERHQARIAHALHRDVLRLVERLVEVGDHPGMSSRRVPASGRAHA